MSITFNSNIEDDILIITASGKDDNVDQVVEYGQSIIRLGIESGKSKILCDERNLEDAIGTFDIFEAATIIAEEAPRVARIAIVCSPEFFEDGRFWETVAVNRGLHVRMYIDINLAKTWLIEGTD